MNCFSFFFPFFSFLCGFLSSQKEPSAVRVGSHQQRCRSVVFASGTSDQEFLKGGLTFAEVLAHTPVCIAADSGGSGGLKIISLHLLGHLGLPQPGI